MKGDDLYPESFTRGTDADRDEELLLLRKSLFTKRLTLFLLALLLIVVVGYDTYSGTSTNHIASLIRTTQTENKPTLDNTKVLVEQQKDCLTPGGKCYERSRRQLVKILGSVRASNIQVTAAGAVCAVGLVQTGQAVTFKPMFSCMANALALTTKKTQ